MSRHVYWMSINSRSIVFAYMRLRITNTDIPLLREPRLRSLQVPSMTMTTSGKLNTTTQKVLKHGALMSASDTLQHDCTVPNVASWLCGIRTCPRPSSSRMTDGYPGCELWNYLTLCPKKAPSYANNFILLLHVDAWLPP
jgi:hypothetical protein